MDEQWTADLVLEAYENVNSADENKIHVMWELDAVAKYLNNLGYEIGNEIDGLVATLLDFLVYTNDNKE